MRLFRRKGRVTITGPVEVTNTPFDTVRSIDLSDLDTSTGPLGYEQYVLEKYYMGRFYWVCDICGAATSDAITTIDHLEGQHPNETSLHATVFLR